MSSADRSVDEALGEWTGGHTGFLTPVWFRIYDGVRITPSFHLDATPIGNAMVLFAEWSLALFLGFRMVRKRVNQPFCAACDQWYTRRIVGTAPLGSFATIRAALVDGQFHRLGRRLGEPSAPQAVTVHAWFCLQCDTETVVLEVEVQDEHGRKRLMHSVTAPHRALDDILDSQALASGKLG